MADDVEADLEAPEAYQIAKEEILMSKMDQERERYAVQAVCVTIDVGRRCGVISTAIAAIVVDVAAFVAIYENSTLNGLREPRK